MAVILVLLFCGYLASLDGPGPYISGMVAFVDLLVPLALVSPTTLRDKASERVAVGPTSYSILLLHVLFCGYLASLGGPGPYISGVIAIFDLVMLVLVSVIMLRGKGSERSQLGRRTRFAVDLALDPLFPVDRQRYREEWTAELGDLPRRDQAPYAFRLLSHAWRQAAGFVRAAGTPLSTGLRARHGRRPPTRPAPR